MRVRTWIVRFGLLAALVLAAGAGHKWGRSAASPDEELLRVAADLGPPLGRTLGRPPRFLPQRLRRHPSGEGGRESGEHRYRLGGTRRSGG